MQPADREEFVRVLTGLAAVKPGGKLTPEALDLWWLALAEWGLAEFKSAASHLARSVEFFPNPFHFEQLRRTAIEQSAGDAWAQVLTAVRTMNPRETPRVSRRIDAVVRQMGGYLHLCTMTSEEMPWRQKRFEELWSDYRETEEAQAALPHLAAVRLLKETKRIA